MTNSPIDLGAALSPPEEVKQPVATPPKEFERGTWLYERDGDLNPTWIFVTMYLILGAFSVIGAMLSREPLAMVAALSFLATMILALLMSALPISKAKVLARARLGEAVADSVAGVVDAAIAQRRSAGGTFELTP